MVCFTDYKERDQNHIAVCTCDCCNRHAVGVMFYHCDTPVLFQCSACNRYEFERVSRRDVDAWLENPDAKAAA